MSSAGVPSIEIVQAQGWAKYPWLIHGFSTRQGGQTTVYRSAGPDLNLGFTASDSREVVEANRKLFFDAVAPDQTISRIVTLRQIHSPVVHVVGKEPAAPATLEGDGLLTREPGVLLAILTADCIPVLIADTKTRAVAALHAGWRGTVAGIAEAGVQRMREEFGTRPEDLLAAIGPGIGPCCYSVGDEVRTQFASAFGYAEELFQERPAESGTALYLDLPEANRRQLLAAGLSSEAIALTGQCTGCATGRFFSHRIEHGHTGRMMSVIGIAQQD
jgi:polyphenol oxidase